MREQWPTLGERSKVVDSAGFRRTAAGNIHYTGREQAVLAAPPATWIVGCWATSFELVNYLPPPQSPTPQYNFPRVPFSHTDPADLAIANANDYRQRQDIGRVRAWGLPRPGGTPLCPMGDLRHLLKDRWLGVEWLGGACQGCPLADPLSGHSHGLAVVNNRPSLDLTPTSGDMLHWTLCWPQHALSPARTSARGVWTD